MNKTFKAYLLMTPLLIIALISIISILYGLIIMLSPNFTFGWTMQDTKTGLITIGFFATFAIIFRMFEKGCRLRYETKFKDNKIQQGK